MQKANAIILAGGKNTRIARNKAFIQLAGKTVLENTINILQKIFPQIGLIQLLLEKCTNQDVVIPETNGEVEPLFAIYSKNCLPVIFHHLQKHDLRIRHILGELRVERVGEEEIDTVDPEHLSFFNINTPEDLKKAQTLLSRASNSR